MNPNISPNTTANITVIIPTLNEEHSLEGLLGDLVSQRDILIEIIVVDGGSTDRTSEIFSSVSQAHSIPLRWLNSTAGRAVQMNTGVAKARGSELLFLHADTRIDSDQLLAAAFSEIVRARELNPGKPVAGHFGLTFGDHGPERDGAYYFYEAKTRLNRPDSINGDQGFWVDAEFFGHLGGFDETLEFMEDVRFALKVAETGLWVNLPGRLTTSARRFESEGLAPRQLLNSFLRCFVHIDFPLFFKQASKAYRAQNKAEKMDLEPFLRLAHEITARGGMFGWLRWWYKTGCYIRDNAWQLTFVLDCKRNRRRGFAPGEGPATITEKFEPAFNLITDNALGRTATLVLSVCTFFILWTYLLWAKEKEHRKMFEEYGDVPFADMDSYRTPKQTKTSWLFRLFGNLYFYAIMLLAIVRPSSKLAQRGNYDHSAWVRSSFAVFRFMEKIGVKFEITGLGNLRKLDGPVVYVANHMSTLETFILPAVLACRGEMTFVIKESLMDYPVFGPIMRSRDPITVGRDNPRDDLMAVLQGGKKKLGEGTSIVVFPQTTRSLYFDAEKFNSIGAKLAARAGVVLVPIALKTDAWGQRRGEKFKDFGPMDPKLPVKFAIGDPIRLSGKGNEAHAESMEFIRSNLESWLNR